jgi:hypothetical protein
MFGKQAYFRHARRAIITIVLAVVVVASYRGMSLLLVSRPVAWHEVEVVRL